MEKIKVDQVDYALKIHQQERQLPDLLMLHGFMGDYRVFDHITNEINTICNPITIDLLGHGQSAKPENPDRYSENKQVSDIERIVSQLELNSFFLFGYSMGGRLALQFALRHSNLLQGLILESTNCGISNSEKRRERQKKDLERAKAIKDDFQHFLTEWQKLDLFQSPLKGNQPITQCYNKIQSEQSPNALAASLGGFGTGAMSPVCDKLGNFSKPVYLLAGTADKKYQKINQNLVAQFPNATFASIPAGHRTHVDNPSKFVNEIQKFIAKKRQP